MPCVQLGSAAAAHAAAATAVVWALRACTPQMLGGLCGYYQTRAAKVRLIHRRDLPWPFPHLNSNHHNHSSFQQLNIQHSASLLVYALLCRMASILNSSQASPPASDSGSSDVPSLPRTCNSDRRKAQARDSLGHLRNKKLDKGIRNSTYPSWPEHRTARESGGCRER